MAQGKNYENLNTEKLKKLLLTYRIFYVLVGIGAICSIIFYFLNREDRDYALLILGMALGVGMSSVATIASKIKNEIKNRDVTN